ncbi:Fic family protein [Hymenobacter sp.]|jgi:Fic family protein|uniref:Fic family protein n=1 Tax=Hymenobacter sp. TaxID=1898978 RepID=UPI002ED83282
MSLFAEVDLLKKELDELRPLSPEQEARILQKFRLDWNYNSNAIEGNSLTLGETRSLLLHGLTAAGKPIRDHLDIKGHNEAVLWLEEIVRNERPLTEQFIRGMHEVLLGEGYDVPAQTPDGQPTRKHIQPGRYKSGPNNVQTATGEMFYFASPEETPGKMTDLVDWYRSEAEQATLHPVALAAEFHYRFVRIHPFDDGNGRMSRLLMNLILMRHGYPMTVIRATDRNRYLAALAEADAGEIEPFFHFVSESVESSLQLMIRAAKGESIDEPDDLDKKLALLKKQVLSREDVLEMTWNMDTQAKLWHNLISFWFEDLSKQLLRFDELFLSKQVVFYYPDVSPRPVTYGDTQSKDRPPICNADRSFEGALYTAEKVLGINSQQLVMNFQLNFFWLEFRFLKHVFNLSLLVDFRFDKYKHDTFALISHADDKFSGEKNIILTSVYKNQYDHLYIQKINYTLANKVYEFIAAKIAEAGTQ